MEHHATIHFHPVLIHFPIAFYALELVLLLFWVVKRNPDYLAFSRFAFRFAYFMMPVAMLAGLIDAGGIDGINGPVKSHAIAALSAFVFYTVRAVCFRFVKKDWKWYPAALILSALIGNLLLIVTGDLGGDLVYGL